MKSQNISDYVLAHGSAVLHQAFDPARLDTTRQSIFDRAVGRIDENNPNCETPRIFRSYWVNDFQDELVQGVFDDFVSLANGFTLLRPDYTRQVIQYPRGGGYLAEHEHALEPQRIGLILMASQRGRDYSTGNVCLKINGEWREVFLNSGDVCLFRHDLPHKITSVDEDASLDWSTSDGRWTFILSIPGFS